MGDDWTLLETFKLLVAVLIPITVVFAGFYVSTRVQKQSSQKLVEKRIEVFDLLAPDYNSLLVYLLYWGSWKEMSPPDVIALKRRVDRNMHVYSWLFKGSVQESHDRFMKECFKEFQEAGRDAGIRSEPDKRRQAHPAWLTRWDSYFTGEPSNERKDDIIAKYQEVMRLITAELKTDAKKHPFVSGRLVTRG